MKAELKQRPPPPSLPDDAEVRLFNVIAATPATSRSRLRLLSAALTFIAAAIVVAIWLAPMLAVHAFDGILPFHPDPVDPVHRPDMRGGFSAFRRYEGLEQWIRIAIATGVAGIAAFVSVLAFARGRSMVGRRGSLLVLLAVSTPVALMLWKWGLSGLLEHGRNWDMYREGFRCMKISLVMGLAPLAVATYLRRRSDPLHPATTGAAMGVAAGAVTWSFVDLTCNVGNYLHLLLGHFLPMVVFAFLGATLGHLFLRIRAR